MFKTNKWTLGLCAVGAISLTGVVQAEEKAMSAMSMTPTTISGYVDTSAHWNPGTGNTFLPIYSPNGAPGGGKADGFNLDVVAITLSKPAQTDAQWSSGYNVTLLYGPDAVGYNNSVGAAAGDFSLKDAYVELRGPVGNGLDFKLGTMAELLGYEVYETGNNPNYTRSYGYEIEPTSMTGFLMAYQFNSIVSASAGIFNTWSAHVNARANPPRAESFKTYEGAVTLTAPKELGFLEGSTLLAGVISGYDAGTVADKTSLYVGGTINTPYKPLKVGVGYDYVLVGSNPIVAPTDNANYQAAVAAYLVWQATEKLSLNTRGDYLTQSAHLAVNGLPKRAVALTETVQYDLWKNVIARAEFRWDHQADGTGRAYGNPGTAVNNPYGGSLRNEFLVALNVIYKF